MKNASGEGEQESWFELSEMESGSWRDCCQSGVNLATPIYRDKPRSKLELIDLNDDHKIFNLKFPKLFQNNY